jgi:outer membrane lipoprotein-sorting protein
MKKSLAIFLTLALISALMVGCGGKDNSTTTSQAGNTTNVSATTSKPATTSVAPTTSLTGVPPSTTPATSAPATTPKTTSAVSTPASTTASAGSDFATILGKANAVTSFYCEVKVTSPEGVQNMKMWFKTGNPNKYKMEISAAGTLMVMIYDGQYYYSYDPTSKKAFKMSAAQSQQYASSSGDADAAAQYNPVLLGSETVNGVDCWVYQYTVQGVTTKMWLAKSNGLTVRIVSGTTTMDYTNYSFSAIPDSTFQLPADAQLVTIPGM